MKLSKRFKMNALKTILVSLFLTFFLIINFANAFDYSVPKTDKEFTEKIAKLK